MTALRSAAELGIVSCHACGLVCRCAGDLGARAQCPRCEMPLHRRKPNSLNRTLAYLIAAAILYVPANILDIVSNRSLVEVENHTILGGVVELWQNGDWDLALVVFSASIVVPIFKIIALAVLLVSAHLRWRWRTRSHARLYRIIEAVGHWSMLDVFVVALMVALVRFGRVAEVQAGPGAVAFGAVVVLTMLASHSFDPRLLWDASERNDTDESLSDALDNN